jgi:hypothetical protein
MTELGQSQLQATAIYEDNDACIKVADSSAPTRQMIHIAIRDFTLQDWTDRDLVTLVSCPSNANASDMFTNQVGKSFLQDIRITFLAGPLSFAHK